VQGGSQQILDGLTAAFDIRTVIQQALGAIMARHQVTADTAYLILRATAADTGATLTATATATIQEQDA
jgi:AmiR/NasT family two-component response regulator